MFITIQDQLNPRRRVRVTCGARHSIIQVREESTINDTIADEFSLFQPFLLQAWDDELGRYIHVGSINDVSDMSQLQVVTLPASVASIDLNNCLTVTVNIQNMTLVDDVVLEAAPVAETESVTSQCKGNKLDSAVDGDAESSYAASVLQPQVILDNVQLDEIAPCEE